LWPGEFVTSCIESQYNWTSSGVVIGEGFDYIHMMVLLLTASGARGKEITLGLYHTQWSKPLSQIRDSRRRPMQSLLA
jgi:hypothetical protein